MPRSAPHHPSPPHAPPAARPSRRRIPRAARLSTLLTALFLLPSCRAPEARFSTIADLPTDLQSAVLVRFSDPTEQGEIFVHINVDQRLAGDLPDRPLLINFTDERPWARPGHRGRPVVLTSIWPLAGGAPRSIPAVVDTGAASTLILSLDTARRADVWLSAEIGPTEGIGFVGPVAAGQGLVRRLQIGPIALAPAEVKVNTEQQGHSAALGLSAFLAFGGLVFDWDNHVIIALPRGRPVRVDHGWVEMAWRPLPDVRLDPSAKLDQHGNPLERSWSMTSRFRGIPVVQAAIAGKSLRVVLDTGGDGYLASLRELPVLGRGRARIVGSHGRLAPMREHTLEGDVRLGSVEFRSPSVVVPDPKREGGIGDAQISLQFFDAVVGIELLRRHPVWFDFERGIVRFWTPDAPLPALSATRAIDPEPR